MLVISIFFYTCFFYKNTCLSTKNKYNITKRCIKCIFQQEGMNP